MKKKDKKKGDKKKKKKQTEVDKEIGDMTEMAFYG